MCEMRVETSICWYMQRNAGQIHKYDGSGYLSRDGMGCVGRDRDARVFIAYFFYFFVFLTMWMYGLYSIKVHKRKCGHKKKSSQVQPKEEYLGSYMKDKFWICKSPSNNALAPMLLSYFSVRLYITSLSQSQHHPCMENGHTKHRASNTFYLRAHSCILILHVRCL